MAKLSDHRLLCFDVYGTLIDWESGIISALQPALDRTSKSNNDNASSPSPRFSREHILKNYLELEHEHQSQYPNMPYSELLAAVHPLLLARLGLPPPLTENESILFGASIGTWPAFPDTVGALRRLSKHYKLVVLSNVDRESFAKTNAGSLCGFPFDMIITAQDVGSYKPDLRNFEYMLREVEAAFGIRKDQVLQTAQSQFHDHRPAQEVGIKSVWIERPGAIMGNLDEPVFNWKFLTLGELADAVDAGV